MRNIGTSDLKIFPLALGGNTFGWTADQAASEDVLDRFTDAGGNFIDTADSYSHWVAGHGGGESETIIGEWMKTRSRRDDVVIATKVGSHPQYPGLSATNVLDAANASLERLQTDYIDLYYAHFDDPETPLLETVAAFHSLVEMGKVRYVGLSNYTPERVSEWLRIARDNNFHLPVALQPHYNLVHRAGFEKGLASLSTEEDLAVFPYWSLAAGFLTGKYRTPEDVQGAARADNVTPYLTAEGLAVLDAVEDVAGRHGASMTTTALAWLLSKPEVTAPLASASTASQLPELTAAVELRLSAADVAALDAATSGF